MGRYQIREVPSGYRIWNAISHDWWGDAYSRRPDGLVAELNGACRVGRVTELVSLLRPYERHDRVFR